MKDLKKKKKNLSKWNRVFGDALVGFWNPWSYCNKRHEYVKSLNYDILELGELLYITNIQYITYILYIQCMFNHYKPTGYPEGDN